MPSTEKKLYSVPQQHYQKLEAEARRQRVKTGDHIGWTDILRRFLDEKLSSWLEDD